MRKLRLLVAIVLTVVGGGGCAAGSSADGELGTTPGDAGGFGADGSIDKDASSGKDADEDPGDGGLGSDVTLTAAEICNNGIDDDGDGEIDEACACTMGDEQPCFPGDAKSICKPGVQKCEGSGEFARWGKCTGAVECKDAGPDVAPKPDVKTDTCGPVNVALEVPTDCSTLACPPSHPFLVGCSIKFDGDDCEGCVAHKPGTASVYVKEGYRCGSSARVAGSYLKCSSCGPSVGALNATNCPILGKKKVFYEADSAKCPTENTCP